MKDYKRLTKRAGWHKDIDLKDEFKYAYIYQRLAELENAIEDGNMVRLPCKVGDEVWTIDISTAQNKAIKCRVVSFNLIDEYGVRIMEYEPIDFVDYITAVESAITEIGKTVFLTKDEAEEKLKGDK